MSSTLAARFWAKVNKDGPVVRPELGPCWVWIGASGHHFGYGTIWVGGSKRYAVTHRVSWVLASGAIDPATPCVLHRCDNSPCVRPDHLFLGTQADNCRDRHAKGRTRTPKGGHNNVGSAHGSSKLTENDVREIRRQCTAGQLQRVVAARFGVRQPIVSRIVSGKHWGHVQ